MIALPQIGSARELGVGNNYPPGLTLGLPVGANPPPVGIYVLERFNYFSGDVGNKTGDKVSAAATAAQVLFSPGWNILGASYMAFISQPFAQVVFTPNGSNTSLKASGAANTAWSPLNLSWNLGGGLFVSTGFTFYGPDGQQQNGPLNILAPGLAVAATNTGGIGAPFWTFEPSLAISYLGNGYNLTAHLLYNSNSTNKATNFRSGDQLFLDLTATKKFGNWELGPVAYYSTQTTSDRDSNGVYSVANALGIGVYTKPTVFAPGRADRIRLRSGQSAGLPHERRVCARHGEGRARVGQPELQVVGRGASSSDEAGVPQITKYDCIKKRDAAAVARQHISNRMG